MKAAPPPPPPPPCSAPGNGSIRRRFRFSQGSGSASSPTTIQPASRPAPCGYNNSRRPEPSVDLFSLEHQQRPGLKPINDLNDSVVARGGLCDGACALGKYVKAQHGDFDLLLSGWSSECTSNNRVSSGRIHLIPTLSALWFVQPVILRELLANNEAFERGLTARLLIFDSKIELAHDDGQKRAIAASIIENWHHSIAHILSIRARRTMEFQVQCAPEATEVFRRFHNEAIDLRRGAYGDVAGELTGGARTPSESL